MADHPDLTIGTVATRTSLSVHALRFYERQGLLISPITRTAGGRRVYSESDVEWLLICVKLRESGMPLVELQRFAELARQGPGNEAERLQLLDTHNKRVEAQIQALEKCRALIAWKVDVYADHLDRGKAAGLWDPTRRHPLSRPAAPIRSYHVSGRYGSSRERH